MLNSSDNVSSRPLDSSWVWSQPWDPPAQGVSQFDGGQGGSDGACRPSDILQGRSEGLTFHNACESCSPVYVDENGARREHQSPNIRCMICIFDEEKIFSHLFAFGPPGSAYQAAQTSGDVPSSGARDPDPSMRFPYSVVLPRGFFRLSLFTCAFHNSLYQLSPSTTCTLKNAPIDHLPFPGHSSCS